MKVKTIASRADYVIWTGEEGEKKDISTWDRIGTTEVFKSVHEFIEF